MNTVATEVCEYEEPLSLEEHYEKEILFPHLFHIETGIMRTDSKQKH